MGYTLKRCHRPSTHQDNAYDAEPTSLNSPLELKSKGAKWSLSTADAQLSMATRAHYEIARA